MAGKRNLKFIPYAALAWLAVGALPASEHSGVVRFGGVPVPGATVTATQGDRRLAAVTGSQGRYAFPDLPDGAWTMRVEMLCFQPLQREVSVSAEAPAVEWELKLLPREEVQAERDAPEVLSANTLATIRPPTENPAEVTTQDAESGVVEGALINGSVNNGANSVFAQSAAFGNSRRRRSRYSGAVQVVVDNSALNARSYSLTGRDVASPAYSRTNGSVTLGGPLQIPGLWRSGGYGNFFSFNYAWTRNRSAQTADAVVPDLNQRAGDFSGLRDSLGRAITITDPTTGLPFDGNIIPAALISDQAKHLLLLYPLPSFQTASGYNYQVPLVSSIHSDAVALRGTNSAGRLGSISASFTMQSTRADHPSIFGFLDKSRMRNLDASVTWNRRYSLGALGTLGVKFSRSTSRTIPYFANRENISGNAGITGNNQEAENWGPPSLSFSSGITALSDANSSLIRTQTAGVTYALQVTGLREHNLKAGAGYDRRQYNLFSQENPRGTFGFTGAVTGYDFASFLLGIPDTISIATGNADKYFRSAAMYAYIGDDWWVSSGLTLNTGLRWEYDTPVVERYDRLVNLDFVSAFSTAAPVVASNPVGSLSGTRYPDSLLGSRKFLPQPRVGVSWRPFAASSLLIRAGYGVYVDTSSYQQIAMRMAQQWPLSRSISVSNSGSNLYTLANGFQASGSAASTSFAVDPAFRGGYAQNWELTLQRDLPFDLTMAASYLGIKGTRALQAFYPNTYPAGAENPCPSCPSGFVYLTSGGNSIRHAGQFRFRRRLRGGLAVTAQYTWAKSIDNAASLGGGTASGQVAQNWLDLRAERGLSNFDQRHVLDVQFQYSTGVGVGGGAFLGGWRGRVVREWTLTSRMTAGSGLPLTPIYPRAVAGTGFSGSLRPDYTGALLYDAPAGLRLNPAAYAAPSAGSWGNAGRNSITGPSQLSLDASLARTFRLTDRFSFDLRLDARTF